jgi:hypothetical protein
MEFLFSKYFWVLNSVLLVVGGYAVSRALTSFVEYEVLQAPSAPAGEEGELIVDEDEGAFRRPQPLRSVDFSRRRELTYSNKPEPVEAPPVEKAPEEAVPEAPVEEEALPVGELTLDLIAVITSEEEGKSMALVKVDGGEPRWVHLGDDLKPGYKVTRITNYYVMASEGVTQMLWKKLEAPAEGPGGPRLAAMGRSVPGGPVRPPPEVAVEDPALAKPEPASPAGSKYAEGIKQVGANEYRIDRGMLNEQLQDLAKLGREARVIPNYDKDSGSYKGFKLIGVRPNSLYRAIGIRSGDVIMQINGEELSSPGKALELFTKLQTSSSITLDIMRRGKQQTMSYKIE